MRIIGPDLNTTDSLSDHSMPVGAKHVPINEQHSSWFAFSNKPFLYFFSPVPLRLLSESLDVPDFMLEYTTTVCFLNSSDFA